MTMPISTDDQSLLSPAFIRQLERLDVLSRKILTGKLQGERRSKKRGQSVEFADYRPYVAGDDLRFIDWNLYARLDRFFLRLFMEEQDLSLSILIDVSRSMEYGRPDKLFFARKLAASLGFVGLVNYNRVSVYAFAQGLTAQLPNLRGRRPLPLLLEFLQELSSPASRGDLELSLRRFAMVHRSRGIVVLLSDFLDKGQLGQALRYLAGDVHDVYAVQILAPQEMDPHQGGVAGDLRLRDMEDADTAEVSVSPALLKRYQANLRAYCDLVRDHCLRRDMAYLLADTTAPVEELVLDHLRQRGLLG